MKSLNKLEISSITYFLMRSCFMGISLNYILKYAKQDSYLSMIVGSILGLLPVVVYLYIIKDKKEQSLKEYLQTKAGKIIGTLVWIFMFFFTLLFTSYVFQEFTHFIQIEYLSKTPRIFILFAFLLPLLYLVKKGIKVIGEVSTILFYFSIILLLITCSSLIFQVDFENLLPVFEHTNQIWDTSFIYVGFNVLPLFFLTNLPFEKNTHYGKMITGIYFLNMIILTVTTFLTVTILGIHLASTYIYPEFHLLKQVSVIGVLGHLESILAFQGIFDSYIMLAIALYYLSTFTEYKHIVELSFVIFLITYLFSNSILNAQFMIYGIYLVYLILPCFVIIICFIKSLFHKKKLPQR